MIPRRNIARVIAKAAKQPGYAVEAFHKRFRSFLTYKFYNGYSAYPETISLFLTYKCNLRCRMCGQWGAYGSSRNYSAERLKEQLSLYEIERLLDDAKGFNPIITLFGGEPLLYKDWPDVVRMVRAKGMRCNIITNGVLLEEKAGEIVDAGVDEIIFSLDGPREIHDEIRGTAGTYDRAMAGFRKLLSLKNEKGLKKPIVNISSSIFETNYERLDEVVTSAGEMGAASITFHHLIFLGREAYESHDRIFNELFSCSSHDWAGFVRQHPPKIDPDKLIGILRKVSARESGTDISVYPNLTDGEVRKYYTSFDFLPDSYKRRCMSPWMVAYVFPDGSVRPCQSLNYSIGNIKAARFNEIWNSSKALRFRGVLKKKRHFPVCPRCTEFYRY